MHRVPIVAAVVFLGACATAGSGERSGDESIDSQLAQIRLFRATNHGDAALAQLAGLLKRVDQDGGAARLAPATRDALAVEIRAADETVRTTVRRYADAGQPLAAEAELFRRAPLLENAAFAATRQSAGETIRQAGQAACRRLQETASATPEAPYWGLAVSRYCAHFALTFAPPPRPAALRAVEVSGQIAGLSPPEAEAFRTRVGEWFRASLWFDEAGEAVARGTVGGTYASSFKRQTVTLHVAYRQTLTTTAFAAGQRPGYKGPTHAVSVTPLDRTFPYDSEEIRGDYKLGAVLTIDVGADRPIALKLRRAAGIKGYDHDVTYAPAGVFPRHDHVPSAAEWLNDQLDALSLKVIWALNRRFVDAHCKAESYQRDDAVRCLLAGQQPRAAMEAVTAALGEPADTFLAILRPAPPPPPADAPVKKRAPAKTPPPKPPSRTSDDEDPDLE